MPTIFQLYHGGQYIIDGGNRGINLEKNPPT